MVLSCCVKGCKSESYLGSGTSFHKFPKNSKIKKKWVDVVPGNVTQYSAVCGLHFKADDFTTDAGACKKRLKQNVIPSIFPVAPAASTSRDRHTVVADTQNLPADAELNSDDDISTDEASMFDEMPITTRKTGKSAKRHTVSSSGRSVLRKDASSGALHEGFECKVCGQDIIGFRYTCVQCEEYNMCASCETASAHAEHYVLRVPGPRPYLEVRAVVQRIRKELLGVVPGGGEDAVEEDSGAEDSADGNEESIKVKEELDPDPDPLQGASHAVFVAATETISSELAPCKSWTMLDEAMEEIKVEVESDDEGPDTTKMPQKRHTQTTHDEPPKRMHIVINAGCIVKSEPMEEQGSDAAGQEKDTGHFVCEVLSHNAERKAGPTNKARTSKTMIKNVEKKAPVPGKTGISAKRKNKW